MGYGDGSIYQTSDGRWRATIETGWTTKGTRRRKTFTGKTKAQVRNKLRDYLADQVSGTVSIDQRMTVKRYADQWVDRQRTRLRPNTFASHAGIVRKWVIPAIGGRLLSELSAADLRAIDKAMRAAGRSTTTIGNAYGVTKKMLMDAREDGYKVPNSALAARRPLKAVSAREALPVPDAVKLLVMAANKDSWSPLPADPAPRHEHGGRVAQRFWTPDQKQAMKTWNQQVREREWAQAADVTRWLAALLQGMRQGEALGLTWDCVDFKRDQLVIEWELRRVGAGAKVPDGLRVIPLTESQWLMPPKTRAGLRVIPMVPVMSDALRAWKEAAPHSPHGLVWPRPDGTYLRASRNPARFSTEVTRVTQSSA